MVSQKTTSLCLQGYMTSIVIVHSNFIVTLQGKNCFALSAPISERTTNLGFQGHMTFIVMLHPNKSFKFVPYSYPAITILDLLVRYE